MLGGVAVEEMFGEGCPEELDELDRAIDRMSVRRSAPEALTSRAPIARYTHASGAMKRGCGGFFASSHFPAA